MITLVKPKHTIMTQTDSMLQIIEAAGRTCYKTEDKITPDSAAKFVKGIIKSGHVSVIEHANVTVRVICDRGVTHEIVRHRLAAYSQESTRYVNYQKKPIAFVIPPWVDLEPGEYEDAIGVESDPDAIWLLSMFDANARYIELLNHGWRPEQARSVLPNSLKTEIVITYNARTWRHVLNQRCAPECHPQMREVMLPLLKEMHNRIPVIFEDIYRKYQIGKIQEISNW